MKEKEGKNAPETEKTGAFARGRGRFLEKLRKVSFFRGANAKNGLTRAGEISYNAKLQGLCPSARGGGGSRRREGRVQRPARRRASSISGRSAARKEGFFHAENVSAEEASQKEGAWLPQKNVHQQRAQGFGAPPCKGQSTLNLLSARATVSVAFLCICRLFRAGRGRRPLFRAPGGKEAHRLWM